MITKEKQELLNFYNIGLQAYKEQRWDDAVLNFGKALAIDANDGPTKLYIDRCKYFKDHPPGEDWDGVYTMTSK